MFEIYNVETNRVVRRCRDVKEAHQQTQNFEEAFKWVDGSRFDYRSMDEIDSGELKRRIKAQRLRKRGGSLNRPRMVRFDSRIRRESQYA